jgi:hypothetical protein
MSLGSIDGVFLNVGVWKGGKISNNPSHEINLIFAYYKRRLNKLT